MEGLNNILNKLSLEDVEKLRVLFSIGAEATTKEVITLRVFCEEYKDFIKSNRSENYYNSVVIALKHLVDYFGVQKSISSIAYKDVEMFMTELQKKVSKGYRVYYRTLKAAFNKAVDWNYIDKNYFVKIKLPKKNRLNPAFIDEAELQKIVKYIKTDVVKDVTVFAFYTGMRLGEIANLKWKNIDWEKRIIIVGDEEFVTKGKRQRYVPICEEVFEILRRIMKGEVRDFSVVALPRNDKDNFIFGKPNGAAFTGDYFSKRFKKACKAADIDSAIHFHSLRHSFASNLAQKGVSLYVIKELLGHSSITTTEIYSHLNMDSLREAVGRLDEGSKKLEYRSQKISTSPKPSPQKGEGLKANGLRLVVSPSSLKSSFAGQGGLNEL